jgi:hypothetical protein
MKNKIRVSNTISDFNYDQSLIGEVVCSLQNNLLNKLESIIVEGLKRKGYEFSSTDEFEAFVKEFCRCEDNLDKKERTYFVNNTPFLLLKHETTLDFRPRVTSEAVTIGASTSFAYL